MNILLLFLFLAIPLSADAADWLTFQGGATRNAVSEESFRVPDRLNWRADLREDLPLAYKPVEFTVPVVAGDMVCAGSSLKRFDCRSKRDGSLIWSFKTAMEIESTASVWEGSVYFGDNSGAVYALKISNGSLLWKFETGGEVLSSPLAVKGILYATNASGDVFALDALTGKKLWQYKRPIPKGFIIRGGSSPSTDGSNIYIGFADGFVVALNPFDGTLLWEKKLAEPRKQFKDIDASPVVDGDSIYVPFYDGSLYSLNAGNGSVNWKFDEGGTGSVVVTKGTVFLPSSSGAVIAIDKATGKQTWSRKLDKAVPSSIIAVDSYLVFGLSNDGVAVISMEKGEEKWKFTPGSGVYGGVAYANGSLYFQTNGGFVYSVPCK